MVTGSPPEVADVVLGLTRSRPPTLGDARLICVDGPAGSGKTTLAEALLTAAPGSVLVHMDDLFEGWDGLPRITAQLDDVLLPLSRGEAGTYRRWDWYRSCWAETVSVPVSTLLVLEGVGSVSLRHTDLITVAVWVEVDYDLRMSRGLARGGEGVAENWRQWAVAEQEHFTAHETRQRADVLVDGTGARPPVLRP